MFEEEGWHMSWLDTLEGIRTKDFKRASAKEREKACRDVLNMCSYACAVVAIAPIPFSDVVLMLPIQTGMVMTVGHIQGRKVTEAAAKDLLIELGAIAGVGILARQGIKALLPVFGALLTVPAAFAANWAIGRAAMEYFRDPDASRDRLREVYKEAKDEGASLFSKVNFDSFRKKHEPSIHEVAEAPAAKKKKPSAKKAKAPAKPKPPKPLTAKWVVEQDLPARLAERADDAREVGATVHLDLSGQGGGKWTVELSSEDDDGFVSSGLSGSPDLKISTDAATFLKLVSGKLDAPTAMFMGALSVDPLNVELAGKIAALLKKD